METHVDGLSAARLDDETRRELRWYFEDFLDHLYDPPSRQRAARLEDRMTELGEALFRDLFEMTRDASTLWATLQSHIRATRIEVATGVHEATAIPWELLQDPRTGRPLVLAAKEFVRVQSKGAVQPHKVRLGEGDPLRILLVICRPRGGADVPFRSVASRLVKGLSAEGRGRIDLTVLRPPTFEQLGKALEAAQSAGKPFHLVHFDGHGTYGQPGPGGTAHSDYKLKSHGPRGYLLFENPDDHSHHRQFVDGRALGALLHKHGVAGLVLNACQSAAAGDDRDKPAEAEPDDPADQVRAQGSLAQETIDAGVGAVLAMRYVVYVETAAHYVGRFYELLAAGHSFGEAATEARATLALKPTREIGGESAEFQDWAVPVVFEANRLPLLASRPMTADPLFAPDAAAFGANDDLPPPPDIGFIGRDAALLDLDRAFDRHAVVLLHAYAGSGKTTTAIEFARWYRDTGGIKGPIWFDSFETHRPLARVLDRIEENFGQSLQQQGIHWLSLDTRARTSIALQILHQVPVLWIWDNVEEVAGFPPGSQSKWTAAEQTELADFLARLKGSKARVLLTSRRDEQGWLVNLPVRIKPGDMPMRERQLMAAALAELHRRPPSVLPALRPLLEWSQGNPMTLGVVIGQALRDNCTTSFRVAEYLERLIAGEAAFDDDVSQGRSRSLGASLAYGFDSAFSEEEQTRLALLHLFQRLVDADVLVWMGEDENPGRAAPYAGVDRAAWTTLLDRAAEIGLLTALGGGYYAIHPALPWFLKTRFDQAFPDLPPPLAGEDRRTESIGGATLARRAWVEGMGGFGNLWHNRFGSGDHGALTILRAFEPNLLQARALAVRHDWWQRAVSAMQGLRNIYISANRWAAWAGLVAEILPLVEDPASGEPLVGREEEWSLITEYRVDLAEQQRDTAAVLALLEKTVTVDQHRAALALAAEPATLDDEQRNRIRSLGVSLQRLARALTETDDSACVTILKEAKALFERLGWRREAAVIAFNLGNAYKDVTDIRDLDTADAAYREALALLTKDDHTGRAKCQSQLGSVAWERLNEAGRSGTADPETLRRHFEAALESYNTALTLLPNDAHSDRAPTHNKLGLIFAAIGALDPAAAHYLQAIRHNEARGDAYGTAQTRFNLADLFRTARRFDDALDYARAARAGFERFDGRAAAFVEKTQRLIARIERKDASP